VLFRFIEPVSMDIRVRRLEDGRYRMEYVEEAVRPEEMPPNVFRTSALMTVRAGEAMVAALPDVSVRVELVELTDDKAVVKIEVVGEKGRIFDSLATEFLTVSNVGKMTLRDLIMMAGVVGAAVANAKVVANVVRPTAPVPKPEIEGKGGVGGRGD